MEGKTTQQNISFLTGGGEMGQLIRAKNWSKTPIGEPNNWPQSFRTTLSIILNSKFPMFLFWGPELICFYNDAYRPSLGNSGKHPDILGSRAEDYWQEIWGDIKPLIDHILAGGEANWTEDQLLPIYRNGKMEDVFWTFSYSAVNDETGKPSGVFVTCFETTNKIKASKDLEESAERFHTLADNISQLAWMADEKGWIYWYNQRWYDYTGTTFEDMQGWGWQKVHHPDHVERVVKRIQHAWDTGEVWEDTFPLRGQDGQYRWFLSRAIPIRDDEGKVLSWFGTNTDITEQNQVIEKLNETVNKLNLYEKVVVNIKEAVIITEAEPFNLPGPRIVYVNEAFCTMSGYKPEEVTGKTPRILQGPKTSRQQLDKIRKALENWQPVRVELINYKKDGTEFLVEFEIVPVANEKGWFTHWVSVQRDVTERKIAEETLRNSEARFHLLAETLPQLTWVTDEKGNREFASQRWEEYTGIEPSGTDSWEAIVHPDDLENINKTWMHCLSTGDIYQHDVRLKSKKGEYRWFTVNAKPVLGNDNKIIKWVGAFNDTHDHKEFAQELKKQVEERTNELQNVNEILLHKNELLTISENFNRTLTEVSPTMVYIHDIEKNRPVFLNSTYLKFIGYSWDEVEELGDKFFNLVIHPDDIHSMSEITAKIRASKPGDVFESNSQRKNTEGVWIPFLNRLTAFKRNSKNEVTQIIGVAIDISELKHAKDVLQQKNKDLENMNKELQSFAYVSSHDLQEPLRKIQTFASRILEKEYQNLSEKGKNYFNRMESAAARMQQLIQDLLAFSRVNSTERVFENYDLKQIVEDVKVELKEELQQKNAVVKANNLCQVQIIPFQFRQLMHNLIGNSLKFSKPKIAPHIYISSEKGKGINFNNPKLVPEQNYCHITIKDNGIGFEKEYSDRVFEIFQRLHGKDAYSGTGIGLAIVKKIVENHNGFISAHGEVGKGATFDIYIPSN